MKTANISSDRHSSPVAAGKSRCGVALFLFVLALGFSSCDFLRDMGIFPGDEDPNPPDSSALTRPPVVDGSSPSIKTKFGVTATGTAGVTAAFDTLHAYIATGGLKDAGNVIRLGDWIDLEGGLAVEAYGNAPQTIQDAPPAMRGAITMSGTEAMTEIAYGDVSYGRLGRLIVVGINSFHSGRGVRAASPSGDPSANAVDKITANGDTDGRYTVTDNDGTSHVVFQFQNMPGKHRMNESATNAGGYAASEMREYLVPVSGKSGSGKFLAGLTAAGVPKEVLWAPKRYVSDTTTAVPIEDLLWLPNEMEYYNTRYSEASSYTHETEENQARLEYYADLNGTSRKKFFGDGTENTQYWIANPATGGPKFLYFGGYWPGAHDAGYPWGVAPAFCVK